MALVAVTGLNAAVAVVFLLVGPRLGLCGHASCAADVSWLTIQLLFMLVWTVLVWAKNRRLSGVATGTARGSTQGTQRETQLSNLADP